MSFVHLNFFIDDERFEMSKKIMKKIQNYVFNKNFVVVIDFCEQQNNFRKIYRCIHYDIETKNWKKFDKHVDTRKKIHESSTWIDENSKSEL